MWECEISDLINISVATLSFCDLSFESLAQKRRQFFLENIANEEINVFVYLDFRDDFPLSLFLERMLLYESDASQPTNKPAMSLSMLLWYYLCYFYKNEQAHRPKPNSTILFLWEIYMASNANNSFVNHIAGLRCFQPKKEEFQFQMISLEIMWNERHSKLLRLSSCIFKSYT